MIGATVIGLLAALAVLYVALPLRRGQEAAGDGLTAEREEAFAAKRAALGAILDLEDERQAGKLSPEDFDVLRSEYEGRAVEAISAADTEAVASSDADLEAEIAALREQMKCSACGAARIPGEPCPQCDA